MGGVRCLRLSGKKKDDGDVRSIGDWQETEVGREQQEATGGKGALLNTTILQYCIVGAFLLQFLL